MILCENTSVAVISIALQFVPDVEINTGWGHLPLSAPVSKQDPRLIS